MKFIAAFLTLIFLGVGMASAQEVQDTIKSQELDDLVVEAQMQRTSATASTYIPLAKQKNSATDAVSLLSQMAIPQLEVNPASSTVKTISGQAVAIFIDYVAATSQDLSGCNLKM
ncbi:MAG: hypothetical protein K2L85_07105 [Paramuribaculum sp.]|nr:hypothetical protein [Paramuribaculum sp.]